MTSGQFRSIHHVGVVVQDLAASVDWYVAMLGFRRLHSFRFPGASVAFVGLETLRLELLQVDGATPMAAERRDRMANLRLGGINHLALDIVDLDATIADLQTRGVDIAAPPMDVPGSGGERFAFIRDGEGMLIELYQQAG